MVFSERGRVLTRLPVGRQVRDFMPKSLTRITTLVLILCLLVSPRQAYRRQTERTANNLSLTEQAVNVPSAWGLYDLLNFSAYVKSLGADSARESGLIADMRPIPRVQHKQTER